VRQYHVGRYKTSAFLGYAVPSFERQHERATTPTYEGPVAAEETPDGAPPVQSESAAEEVPDAPPMHSKSTSETSGSPTEPDMFTICYGDQGICCVISPSICTDTPSQYFPLTGS
jgi:hypothetical protein